MPISSIKTPVYYLVVFLYALSSAVAYSAQSRSDELGEPLVRAAQEGQLRAVQQLLIAGAPVNFRQEKTGHSALHWATWRGHIEMVQLLLTAGAGVNICNSLNCTPLMDALKTCEPSQALAMTKILLDAGATVLCQDGMGNTPLMFAAGNPFGYVGSEVVRLLLASGAIEMLNHRNKYEETALIRAFRYSHYRDSPQIIKQLLSAGARDLPDKHGGTLLVEAGSLGRSEVVQLLLQYGTKPTRGQLQHFSPNGPRA